MFIKNCSKNGWLNSSFSIFFSLRKKNCKNQSRNLKVAVVKYINELTSGFQSRVRTFHIMCKFKSVFITKLILIILRSYLEFFPPYCH